MNKSSLFIRIIPVLLTVSLLTGISCTSEKKGHTSDTIDSLLIQLEEIQASIGSPEIQRLNEFYEEIRDDLSILSGSGYDSGINIQMIQSYRLIDNNLNACLQSCNQFHEEAFLIESSLKEIAGLLEKRNENPGGLEKRLQDETELLSDLKKRVDSTRSSADLNVRSYYLLKPRIDSLITISGSPQGNYE